MTVPYEFSPSGYAGLIGALRAQGYAIRGYSDADPAARHLIVRHDVDFSLPAARAMAEQEQGLGVAATYFILLRTEFYNPLSPEGLAALRRILECGHDIGLHFDAALYSDASEMASAAERECAVLESFLNRRISTVSFHRPAPERIGEADAIGGRLNAYSKRFVKDMGYCSDSRGAWGHGEPLSQSAVRESRALQLLIHPFWWQAPAMLPAERLKRFLAERGRFLDHELARHCTVHRADS